MGQKQTKSLSENVESMNSLLEIDDKKTSFSRFNEKFDIINCLGDGHTSRVYLGQDIKNPNVKVAIKIFKQGFFKKNQGAV